MKCNGCGFENVEGAGVCSGCDQVLESSPVVAEVSESGSPPAAYAAPASGASSSAYAAPPPASVPSPQAPASPASPAASAPSTYSSAPSAYSSAPSAYSSAPSYNTAPARTAPYPYPQPYYYQPVQRPKRPFTITDAYIIIGFVLAVVGVFAYAFILLPASIGFSIVGFVKRTNARTLGLSIAGIVVGVVACLIKVGMVLNELGIIPDWLSAGIF